MPDQDSEVNTWYPVNLKAEGQDKNYDEYANIEVKLFDRSGRLIVEYRGIKDPNSGEGWDGTYNGEYLPTGDYWYYIKLNDSKNQEFRGHITLYRKD